MPVPSLAKASVLRIGTSWGPVVVEVRGGRVTRCALPHVDGAMATGPKVGASKFEAALPADLAVLRAADRFVRAMLRGRSAPRPPLLLPPPGTFRARALRALAAVASGRTLTYGGLARAAGSPRAARAAGSVCATNEIPLFVPCHRILAAGGRLGGFSGGLAWKRLLLDLEAAQAGRAAT